MFSLFLTGTTAGWYIYAESSGGSNGDRALLSTTRIGQTGPQCVLSFWYHMYGQSVGTLSVKLSFLDGTQPVIWTKSGDQGNSWLQSRLVIGSRQLLKVSGGCVMHLKHLFLMFLLHPHMIPYSRKRGSCFVKVSVKSPGSLLFNNISFIFVKGLNALTLYTLT